ncbi:hypothetical protein HN371_19700 [Candidatus Poribacteria bacterium]|nr:hypothetical protein [Candidatus Poribacteria bacterium]MBT5531774.1 hypothetical protein [Candidatus Poribacteria bacterium]MBT5713831.1 hypothetical protein [Candidatus Poribacteria bacterium]MBT7804516.1 hypothetical protein [Candidatus Poribacteria bacterium]
MKRVFWLMSPERARRRYPWYAAIYFASGLLVGLGGVAALARAAYVESQDMLVRAFPFFLWLLAVFYFLLGVVYSVGWTVLRAMDEQASASEPADE